MLLSTFTLFLCVLLCGRGKFIVKVCFVVLKFFGRVFRWLKIVLWSCTVSLHRSSHTSTHTLSHTAHHHFTHHKVFYSCKKVSTIFFLNSTKERVDVQLCRSFNLFTTVWVWMYQCVYSTYIHEVSCNHLNWW